MGMERHYEHWRLGSFVGGTNTTRGDFLVISFGAQGMKPYDMMIRGTDIGFASVTSLVEPR